MGREWRLRLWHEIEKEFGESVGDAIQGLREQGNSWRTVAGALGVSRSTLVEWRKELGLPVNTCNKVTDPSSYPPGGPPHHLNHRAQELGYEDAQDAVLDLRLNQKLTVRQAAQVLGCHYQTVVAHTPKKVRGLIYNRSERWWKVRRRQAKEMLRRFKAKKLSGGLSWHPFNRDNDAMWRA
jgi:hypothetical protein